MSLRIGLLALAFSAAALPALAHDSGAAPGAPGAAPAFRDIETQYIFGFTSGADIGAEGEKEVEVTTDANFRKRAGRFSTLSSKVELEYVPTQFLQLALGARGTVHAIRNVPGVADVNQTQFGGLSAEAKYLLVERSPNQPFALSLIAEPAWSRVGGEGGRERAFEIESKLAGDVMLIPNRLYAAANLIWEPEAVKDRGARAYAREPTLGLTGALTWRATPRLALGGELGYFRAYDSYFLSKYVGQALYTRPDSPCAGDEENLRRALMGNAGRGLGAWRPRKARPRPFRPPPRPAQGRRRILIPRHGDHHARLSASPRPRRQLCVGAFLRRRICVDHQEQPVPALGNPRAGQRPLHPEGA